MSLGCVRLGSPERARWGAAFDKFLCEQSPSEIHQEHMGSDTGAPNQQPPHSLVPHQQPELDGPQALSDLPTLASNPGVATLDEMSTPPQLQPPMEKWLKES